MKVTIPGIMGKGDNDMSEQGETGSLAKAYEIVMRRSFHKRVNNYIQKLSNGLGHVCTPEAHKAVSEGTALSLEMHLAILDILTLRAKTKPFQIAGGGFVGSVITIVIMILLKRFGIDLGD